ncbi:MAG: response regulator [Acidobacteria bacterium]|nr:response regulator [Acidobacteriota bacterium]
MEPINVLLVDDDNIILKLVSTYLRMHGVSVATAQNGQEALEHLKINTPELIIADIDMPIMGGYELYRQVKISGHEDIPFFFCSAASGLPERIVGLQMGADDYIVKPINPPELLLKIKLHLVKARQFRFMKKLLQEQKFDYVMSGKLGDTDVPGLLQIISFLGHRDFYLEIDNPSQGLGEIYLSNGIIVHAASSNQIGKKALFRILDWHEGTFKVEKKLFLENPTVNERLEECLLDTVAKLDEYKSLFKRLTEEGEDFILHSKETPDSKLLNNSINNANNYQILINEQETSIEKLEEKATEPYRVIEDDNEVLTDSKKIILKLIEQYNNIYEVLNQSPLLDLETLEIVDQLVIENIVKTKKFFE